MTLSIAPVRPLAVHPGPASASRVGYRAPGPRSQLTSRNRDLHLCACLNEDERAFPGITDACDVGGRRFARKSEPSA
jgi:hypothetical protein